MVFRLIWTIFTKMCSFHITKIFFLYCIVLAAHSYFSAEQRLSPFFRFSNTFFLVCFFVMFLWSIYHTMFQSPEPRSLESPPIDENATDNDNNNSGCRVIEIPPNNDTTSDSGAESDSSEISIFTIEQPQAQQSGILNLLSKMKFTPNSTVVNTLAHNNLLRRTYNYYGFRYFKPSVSNKFCAFCKENGESQPIFTNHNMKDIHGRCTCPFLQLLVCPICKASGADAHTIQFCPSYTLVLAQSGASDNTRPTKNSGGTDIEVGAEDSEANKEIQKY